MRNLFVGVSLALAAAVGCNSQTSPPTSSNAGPPQDLMEVGKVKREDDTIVGLQLYGKKIRDVDFKASYNFPELVELSIQECDVTDAVSSSLSSSKKLESLKLLSVPLTDKAIASLSDTNIKDLQIARTFITGSGLPALTTLERLSLFGDSFTPDGLRSLAQLTRLEELTIDSNRVVLSDLPALAPLENLFVFQAGRTQAGRDGLNCLKNLSQLRELHLMAADVTDEAVAVLNNLTSLEALSLDAAALTNDGLRQLHLPNLSRLSISNCKQVTDAGLSDLKLPNLQQLNLSGSGVEGKDLTGLKTLPKLKKVTLSGEQFRGTDESLRQAKEAMPQTTIEILRG